ncbi:hypothetical protein BJL83_14555 [Vibrio parahaemolyticus]|nr:hypothetical protein BJL83_14555 [Vibrio parahaemolyticus]
MIIIEQHCVLLRQVQRRRFNAVEQDFPIRTFVLQPFVIALSQRMRGVNQPRLNFTHAIRHAHFSFVEAGLDFCEFLIEFLYPRHNLRMRKIGRKVFELVQLFFPFRKVLRQFSALSVVPLLILTHSF